jgi:hypothetical protein
LVEITVVTAIGRRASLRALIRAPALEMAAHERPRTTKLYDRTKERLTQAEVQRIRSQIAKAGASGPVWPAIFAVA